MRRVRARYLIGARPPAGHATRTVAAGSEAVDRTGARSGPIVAPTGAGRRPLLLVTASSQGWSQSGPKRRVHDRLGARLLAPWRPTPTPVPSCSWPACPAALRTGTRQRSWPWPRAKAGAVFGSRRVTRPCPLPAVPALWRASGSVPCPARRDAGQASRGGRRAGPPGALARPAIGCCKGAGLIGTGHARRRARGTPAAAARTVCPSGASAPPSPRGKSWPSGHGGTDRSGAPESSRRRDRRRRAARAVGCEPGLPARP